MKLILTRAIFLILSFGVAGVLMAREEESLSGVVSQDEDAAVGFGCRDGEPNQARPDVKWSLGDVTKKALELPRPKYPQAAKVARVYGSVQAEVVVDINSGRVVWARVLSGHPLLRDAVRDVVCRARFSPTNDVDGRVSGILTYRFARRR